MDSKKRFLLVGCLMIVLILSIGAVSADRYKQEKDRNGNVVVSACLCGSGNDLIAETGGAKGTDTFMSSAEQCWSWCDEQRGSSSFQGGSLNEDIENNKGCTRFPENFQEVETNRFSLGQDEERGEFSLVGVEENYAVVEGSEERNVLGQGDIVEGFEEETMVSSVELGRSGPQVNLEEIKGDCSGTLKTIRKGEMLNLDTSPSTEANHNNTGTVFYSTLNETNVRESLSRSGTPLKDSVDYSEGETFANAKVEITVMDKGEDYVVVCICSPEDRAEVINNPYEEGPSMPTVGELDFERGADEDVIRDDSPEVDAPRNFLERLGRRISGFFAAN